ncbi:TatD family hydrolase [Desulfofalx alkaliphila]|uniref:TatD family hydrolase n=1 Tax=Desulfofalx alkaliphila TaxID=105483 RepID=UPI0004E2644C|nr:TatD family hydrolase [Desulfofalx alkaliphila]
MSLIDSHAHLDDRRFDDDRDRVIRGAYEGGVKKIINIGHDLPSSGSSVQLAEKYPFIYATVGIHPHDAKNVPGDYLQQLEVYLQHPKVLAVGEIGLDYYYDFSPRDRQKEVFVEQLRLAERKNMPVVIHLRDAYGDFLDIMKEEGPPAAGGVMHCYSGSWELAQACLKMGFYISFAGPVTFKNAVKLKEVAKKVPLERMLVETDCPYLTPVPHRGKRNQPLYVQYVAEEIAKLKDLSVAEVSKALLDNTLKVFRISEGGGEAGP